VFRLALALEAVGCLATAAAGRLGFIFAGRLLQGLGGGPILSVVAAMIAPSWPQARQGRSMGTVALVYGTGFVLGLTGSPLLIAVGWRWVFVVLTAVAATALALAGRQRSAPPVESRAADVTGGVLLVLALSCLALGINRIRARVAADTTTLVATAVGAALVLAFWRAEHRAEEPLLPPALFARREVRALAALRIGTGIGQAVVIQFPSLAVAGLGTAVKRTGVLMLPLAAGGLAATALITVYLDPIGAKRTIALGAASAVAGVVVAQSPAVTAFEIGVGIVGLGMGSLTAQLRYATARAAPAEEQGHAQGAMALLTNVGLLLASALLGALAAWGPDEGAALARAMLAAAALMALAFAPARALRPHLARQAA
jgi:MFS family permease